MIWTASGKLLSVTFNKLPSVMHSLRLISEGNDCDKNDDLDGNDDADDNYCSARPHCV